MEDDFILEMDLIDRHGLTIDPVKEVLRLENKAYKIDRLSEVQTLRLGWSAQNTVQQQEESSCKRWWMDYNSI